MSAIIKVFLLLTVVACITKAQLNEAGQSCLCQRYRNGIDSKSNTKDIQFYPATIFCNKIEIVVTSGNGFRYCLNPELQVAKKMITRFLKARKTSTSEPTDITGFSGIPVISGSSDTSSNSGTSSTSSTSETSSNSGTSSTSETSSSTSETSSSTSETSSNSGTSSTSETSSSTSGTSETSRTGSWCLAE